MQYKAHCAERMKNNALLSQRAIAWALPYLSFLMHVTDRHFKKMCRKNIGIRPYLDCFASVCLRPFKYAI
jgi:hypothetical protein